MREKLGREIAKMRLEEGLRQEELAERVGVIRTTITKVEQGRFNTGVDLYGRIAEALGAELKIEKKDKNRV